MSAVGTRVLPEARKEKLRMNAGTGGGGRLRGDGGVRMEPTVRRNRQRED
jgi:hypothetical protein